MAILAQCPICRNIQSLRNKKCKCGEDLDSAKRSQRVKYWLQYRLPGGKQRKEYVGVFEGLNGNSIEDARTAHDKRKTQKKEKRLLDIKSESKMTFNELTDWYLNLKTVKKLTSYNRVKIALNNFNKVFGGKRVNKIMPVDLENYQEGREEQGLSPATIDMETTISKTMVNKAFDNEIVEGRVLKAFRVINRKLKKGSNARTRTLSFEEYLRLIAVAPIHQRATIVIAFNTGMRIGEIRTLKWSYIDTENGFIKLPKTATKERKERLIPINYHVNAILNELPRALHHNFVITYKGESIKDIGGLKRSFKTACKNAEIPCGRKTPNGLTFHDIRRTVKTNMLNAGIDKVHRDMIIGHSLKGMDVHYIVPDEDALKEAMEKYTKWLDVKSANVTQTVTQNEKIDRIEADKS